MKKVLLIAIVLLLHAANMAGTDTKPRVAVFDPIITSSSLDDDLKTSIREIITATIVNSGKYNTVERSLLEKVLQEQEFSNSGIVDDNNAVEIGKLTGANKVVVSLITPAGSKGFLKGQKNMISIKIIDVKTANIDKQKIQKASAGNSLDVAASLTEELINGNKTDDLNNISLSTNVGKDHTATPKETKKENKNNYHSEFTLHLDPGYIPEDPSHRDNYIEVLLNGDVVGGGTLTEGFDIKIKEKKPRKYKLEIRPTSTSDNGKIDSKAGRTNYDIDTRSQQYFDFMIQSQRKGRWTIYMIRRK